MPPLLLRFSGRSPSLPPLLRRFLGRSPSLPPLLRRFSGRSPCMPLLLHIASDHSQAIVSPLEDWKNVKKMPGYFTLGRRLAPPALWDLPGSPCIRVLPGAPRQNGISGPTASAPRLWMLAHPLPMKSFRRTGSPRMSGAKGYHCGPFFPPPHSAKRNSETAQVLADRLLRAVQR